MTPLFAVLLIGLMMIVVGTSTREKRAYGPQGLMSRFGLLVALAGIGILSWQQPAGSLFTFMWYCFAFLGVCTTGTIASVALVTELLFIVYWIFPAIPAI